MSGSEDKSPIGIAHEKAEQWRGYFLDKSANLEHMLAVTLSYFFCEGDARRTLFLSDIVTQPFFSFRHKVDLFTRIAKRNYPHYEFKPPTIFRDLVKVMEFRNLFAHYSLHGDAKKSIGGLCFRYFEDGKRKEKFISDEDFQKIKSVLEACHTPIFDVRELFSSALPSKNLKKGSTSK